MDMDRMVLLGPQMTEHQLSWGMLSFVPGENDVL